MDQEKKSEIFALRTTANREDQVMDFVTSNVEKKKLKVYSVIRAHGMRGYVFLEAFNQEEAEIAAFNVPYARGILRKKVDYKEIEHMLEQVKVEMNIKKSDIVEIISGPFRREQAKVTRIDQTKEEVVVELLEAAVPIPITVKMDSVKVIRREDDGPEEEISVPLMPEVEEKEFKMPEQDSSKDFKMPDEEDSSAKKEDSEAVSDEKDNDNSSKEEDSDKKEDDNP